MRTIAELLAFDGSVYVFAGSKNLTLLFLKQAEEEGFTFSDGTRPTEKDTIDNIFAVNLDWTLQQVGWAGHMKFYGFSNPEELPHPFLRVDFAKYLSGRTDYRWTRQS